MNKVLLACAALAAAACDSKPTWETRAVGALSLEFPCKPEESAAVVKCARSDGTEFSVATVDKGGLTTDQELAETKAYVEGMPKSELLEGAAFPLKWREVRTNLAYESWQWYVGGKEYTAKVAYTSEKPPPIVAEFFAKVKAK
jgi:hypothetical protein